MKIRWTAIAYLGLFLSVSAADPVMLDLNFDGHLDRIIIKGKTEVGSKYEIKLYDPQTKSYRFDPVFSEYIVGLPPVLFRRTGRQIHRTTSQITSDLN